MSGPELRTERLLLRRWRAEDLESFAAINADERVMEHSLGPLTRARTEALMERFEASFERQGYGMWAVEISGERTLAGFVGITDVEIDVPFAPAVELGWRLARECWGRGLASEAAGAAVVFAFDRLELAELVAYTAAINARSRRLMERLGMTREQEGDFRHPAIPREHRLSEHVLYRLAAGAPAAE